MGAVNTDETGSAVCSAARGGVGYGAWEWGRLGEMRQEL